MADLVVPGIRDEVNGALDGLMTGWGGLPIPVVLTHLVAETPPSALPHLAAGFHMLEGTAWKRASTDNERRGLIGDAVRRHGLKGTLAGLRLAASDAGGRVVSVITPPAKIYLGSALTIRERNEFADNYPQLRIYRHRTRGTGVHTGFVARHRYAYPAVSDAALRVASRAFLRRGGVETELAVLDRTAVTTDVLLADIVRVAKGAWSRHAAFSGKCLDLYPTRSDAGARMFTMRTDKIYVEHAETIHRRSLTAGLEPIDTRPELVSEKGLMDSMMPGRAFTSARSPHNGGRGFLMVSSAAYRVYHKTSLFDPDLAVKDRDSSAYLNGGILTMPHHHAEAVVQITDRMDVKRWAGQWAGGYLVTRGHQALRDCLESMREYQRAADKIDINTNYLHVCTAGMQQVAGVVVAGDLTINR